jgi:solute carrier family 45 protein 1/2/4
VTVIFFFCTLTTLTSFREIPLRLLEADEMLRPLTQMVVKKEKERLKALEGIKQPTTSATFLNETDYKSTQNENQNGVTYVVATNDINHQITKSNGSISSSSDEDDDDSDEGTHVSFMTYLKSIIFMPKELRILCITNCFAWMGQIVYALYFTDFVGESVFKGDPSADKDSAEYQVFLKLK